MGKSNTTLCASRTLLIPESPNPLGPGSWWSPTVQSSSAFTSPGSFAADSALMGACKKLMRPPLRVFPFSRSMCSAV